MTDQNQSTLEGRVAVITGASSGIGEATANALASRGASVALLARRKDKLEALNHDIRKAGGLTASLLDFIIQRFELVFAAGE